MNYKAIHIQSSTAMYSAMPKTLTGLERERERE
jgi:hypothetical protein